MRFVMSKVLVIDDDVDFLVEAQRFFPEDTEWLATVQEQEIEQLTDMTLFDYIIARKKHEGLLKGIVSDRLLTGAAEQTKVLKKLILLPDRNWQKEIRHLVSR